MGYRSTLKEMLIVGFIFGLSAIPSLAAPTKTVCPKLIAEKRGEIYYPRENYRCFSSVKAARRAGLIGVKSLVNPNYSGWWRFNLTLSTNSCGGASSASSPTTYFLQLKHDQSTGLFGSLCPGADTFVGPAPRKDPNAGFSMTSSSKISNVAFCANGEAQVSYIFEARDFDSLFSDAKSAKLTQVTVCSHDASVRCRATWTGAGARESTDHRFWPQIHNDINQFSSSCTTALSTCQGCHAAPSGSSSNP